VITGCEYIHDIPGRLRIRCGGLRKNETRATAVREALASMTGVKSVVVNPLTGSATLHYDAAALTVPAVLAVLKAHGCFDDAVSGRRPVIHRPAIGTTGATRSRAATTTQPSWLTKAVAGFLVEKAIERSLHALVAVVL
jgi:hypothetical protein